MKTTKVRICVCVAEDGSYYALGYPKPTEGDEELRQYAAESFIGSDKVYNFSWIEAEVPLPETEETVIQGKVLKDRG